MSLEWRPNFHMDAELRNRLMESGAAEDAFDIITDWSESIEILAEGSITQQQLIRRTGVSQSTVSRVLTKFQYQGLITTQINFSKPALLGTTLWEKCNLFLADVEQFYTAEEILHDLPADVRLPPLLFEQAEVATLQLHAPNAAISPLLRLTREATRIRAVSIIFYSGYVDTLNNRLAESDLEAEFLMTDAVVEQVLREYITRDRPTLETNQPKIFKIDSHISYSLVLIDTSVEKYTGVFTSADGGSQGITLSS